jgi:chemotaxis protein CheZ
MENCEKIIEATKDSAPGLFQQVETHIVKIFEACTFQDIVGQRIKKVMGCLKEIDAKTASVLKALQQDEENGSGQPVTASGENVVSLLNGPALPQNAITQDDIDKLLAEFDSNNT